LGKISLSPGNSSTAPNPQVGPPTARACGARTLQFAPSALVPDPYAQIMVTLANGQSSSFQNTKRNHRVAGCQARIACSTYRW